MVTDKYKKVFKRARRGLWHSVDWIDPQTKKQEEERMVCHDCEAKRSEESEYRKRCWRWYYCPECSSKHLFQDLTEAQEAYNKHWWLMARFGQKI